MALPAAAERTPAPAAERGGGRDLRLDLFRGIALFLIFVDHIPENTLNYFTLPSVGFSDAAEIFIFISGFAAALVYGRTAERQGLLFAAAQVWRRVWQLYVAHVFIFVIFTAEVSYTIVGFNNPMFSEELRVADFLAEPHHAIIEALLLQFQPTFLDILPLYIVLLGTFPITLALLRRGALWALLPSAAVYLVSYLSGWSIPAYPEGHVWFFNPLNWQLLFTMGAVLGHARVTGRALLPPLRLLVVPAAAIVAVSFVICLSWTIHGVVEGFPGLFLKTLWPISKSNLSPIRIVHFLALATLVAWLVPATSALLRSRLARPAVLCGQRSLQIFCLGILLSVLGHFILSDWDSSLPTQIGVNLAGFLLMIGTAYLLDWYRAMDRARRPAEARPADGRPSTAIARDEPQAVRGAVRPGPA